MVTEAIAEMALRVPKKIRIGAASVGN